MERASELEKAHEGGIECLVANDQHLFSASSDNSIKVFIRDIVSNLNEISNQIYIYQVWDIKRNRMIYSLEEHDKPVHILCVSDRYLFSGSGDKTIKVTFNSISFNF